MLNNFIFEKVAANKQIKLGLSPIKDKVGISTGVSDIGLDAMLSRCFSGEFSTNGVVSWMIGKITLEGWRLIIE